MWKPSARKCDLTGGFNPYVSKTDKAGAIYLDSKLEEATGRGTDDAAGQSSTAERLQTTGMILALASGNIWEKLSNTPTAKYVITYSQ